MESFHLSVGLGRERPDAFVGGSDGVEGGRESPASGVGEGVVGHYTVDAVAETGEPLSGSKHEPGTGLSVFGVEDFGVRDPGMVVDHRMAELVADLLSGAPVLNADRSPSATVGNPAQLFDIDMDQLPRTVLHIADWDTRGPIKIPESGQSTPFQHGIDRRPRHLEPAGHEMRALTFGHPVRDNCLFGLFGQPGRTPVRPRRPVEEANFTFGTPPLQPPIRRLTRNSSRLRPMRHRPPQHFDPIHQQPPAKRSQTSRSVSHEGLQEIRGSSHPRIEQAGPQPIKCQQRP